MVVTFESPGGYKYQVKPLDGGNCWRVYRKPTKATGRNGKPIKQEWVALDCYPWDFEMACKKVTELILKDEEIEVNVKCGECAACELKAHLKNLQKAMGM